MSDPEPPAAASLDSRVLALLVAIAPDVDPGTVKAELDFRDQFDFDSMDLFNFAVSIHQHFGIEIPESDYRRLAGLRKCVAYLQRKLSQSNTGSSVMQD
jgi:acyl carrier protein